MIKTNELENRLAFKQQNNPLMGFTLRKDTVKDLAAHAFGNKKINEEFMMKGFTPFCIQQMDDDSEMNLILHEEQMAQIMTTSYSDLEKKSKKPKVTPISDVLGFISAIANTHALAKVLFSTTSPLTIGLDELQKIVLIEASKSASCSALAIFNQTISPMQCGRFTTVAMIFSRCVCLDRICWKGHVSGTHSKTSAVK